MDDKELLKNVDISKLSHNIKNELSVLGTANREIVSKYIILSIESFEAGEIKNAIKLIKKAVLRAGRISYVRKLAGTLYYNNLNFKKAINELNAANRLSGSNDLDYMLADSYRAIGDLSKANDILKKSINNNFDNLHVEEKVETLIVYSAVKRELGDENMSKLLIDKALKIADSNTELVDRINNSL